MSVQNPPAFPRPSTPNGARQDGMTLRDWFAGQALPAVVAATSAGQHHPTGFREGGASLAQAMATDAYELADAMLAERAKPGEDA